MMTRVFEGRLTGGRTRAGAALVIVLAFLVLLTGLIIAFFSATLTERQSSNASANQSQADMLARDALDLVVGDLRAEIEAGSATPAETFGDTTVFTPTDPATRVPARIGVPEVTGSGEPLANLVRRSARSGAAPDFVAPTTGYSDFPANRASASSTGDVSQNGRFLTAARWNAPYLLPLTPAAVTNGTSEPTADFANHLPDWVIVTRSGASPKTNADVSSMRDRNSADFALGRFAYTIYDEGGLLDVNVAGFPSGLTDDEVGGKGSLAFSDLTSLPAGTAVPAAKVDGLVGWRNYASGQPGGTFPDFTFDATSASRWLENFVEDNETGYLRTPGLVFNGRTDQAFVSRQQLLELWRSLDLSPEALRFLGTFSRDLAQPSFRPDPARPRIVGPSDPEQSSLRGGNMAVGLDDQFNPDFVATRVKAGKTFTRASDGTEAKVGEPLVKYRFPLERLAWVTADGPSASISSSDPRFDEDGTVDNIKDFFGLTWNTGDREWDYDHGDPTRILRLSELADGSVGPPREPDFFELLQAAIHVGSLGRSFTQPNYFPFDGPSRLPERSWHHSNANTEESDLVAAQPKYQVLRIGASIIDQADPDNFPTIIRINDRAFAGMERLPMLTRVSLAMTTRSPSGGDTGALGVFLLPEVWDPHDSSEDRPANVTIRCTLQPEIVNPGWTHQLKIQGVPNSTGGDAKQFITPPPDSRIIKSETPPNDFLVTVAGDSFEKTIPASDKTYDKPTLMLRNGTQHFIGPTASGLPRLAGLEFELFDPLPSYAQGFPAGKSADNIASYLLNSEGNLSSFTVSLEYQDSAGVWHVYNEVANTMPVRDGNTRSSFLKPSDTAISDDLSRKLFFMVRPDPRTSRFPMARPNGSSSESPFIWQQTFRDSTSDPGNFMQRYANSNSAKDASKPQRDPPIGWTPGPVPISNGQDYEYSLGLLSVNQDKAIGGKKTFYADPDGVVRGADGMYFDVPSDKTKGDPITDGPATTPNQARPVVLNRPFRNVGELGYVFRDEPFKTVNFFAANSGDAALLDVFCINEPAENTGGVVAGAVNLNTRNEAVLAAIIRRTIKDESPAGATTFVSDTEVANLAAALAASTTAKPAINPAELVARVAGDPSDPTATPAVPTGGTDAAFKRRRETAVRALSGVTTARVWNLLIDLVAQTGRYPAGATTLSEFVVEGEKRYWLHVAIDRFTGEVIDRQLEPVAE